MCANEENSFKSKWNNIDRAAAGACPLLYYSHNEHRIFNVYDESGESTLSKTNLRNEAVLIVDSLNKALENADEFGLGDLKGQELTKVTPVKVTKTVNPSNLLDETRTPIPVIFSGGNLSIDGKPVNNENISLEGSHFFISDDSSQLICKLVLKEKTLIQNRMKS